MAWITRCKNTHKYVLTKDPNFRIFSDTSGRIIKTYQIEWIRFYLIFDNDDLLDIQNNQLTYKKIRDSGLYAIASRFAIVPYNDTVKWIVDYANLKYWSFNDSTWS